MFESSGLFSVRFTGTKSPSLNPLTSPFVHFSVGSNVHASNDGVGLPALAEVATTNALATMTNAKTIDITTFFEYALLFTTLLYVSLLIAFTFSPQIELPAHFLHLDRAVPHFYPFKSVARGGVDRLFNL